MKNVSRISVYICNYKVLMLFSWNQVRSPINQVIWQFRYYVSARLDHVRCEIEKSTSATMDATATFAYCEPCPLWYLLAASAQRVTPLISCVHMHATIAIYNLHRATLINPLLVQELCQGISSWNHMQQTNSLHEVTYTYTSHVLVSASLKVATPTDPSRYLFVHGEYTLLGTYNVLLTNFLSVFHSLSIRVTSRIAVRVSGPSGSAGHPGQQSWPSFNTSLASHLMHLILHLYSEMWNLFISTQSRVLFTELSLLWKVYPTVHVHGSYAAWHKDWYLVVTNDGRESFIIAISS